MVKFLRRTWKRYSKLGRKRKKKQVWRSPKGRDNKMREKRKGYPSVVSLGYKKPKKIMHKLEEKTPILVNNIHDLEKIKKEEIALIGHVGKKKKIDIIKRAKEKKIKVYNINVNKFLKELNKKPDKTKEEIKNEPKKEKKTG